MRKPMFGKDLMDKAQELAQTIVIRTYNHGCSSDDRRDSTDEECNNLFRLFYGVLLGLNYNSNARRDMATAMAIVDTAEFMAHQIWAKYETEHDMEINWYDTLYLPLQMTLKEWEEE